MPRRQQPKNEEELYGGMVLNTFLRAAGFSRENVKVITEALDSVKVVETDTTKEFEINLKKIKIVIEK